MHIDRRFLNWSVFFILLGLVPLAVQVKWIDASVVSNAWRLWPLILVGIGIGLVLRRSALAFTGGLIVAATFGLMFGSALAGGFGGDLGFVCGSGKTAASFPTQNGALGSMGTVSLEVNCADVTVGTTPGSGWTVSGTASNGVMPTLDVGQDRLAVRQAARAWMGPFGTAGDRETWSITLPSDPTLELNATMNAGAATYRLAGAHLSSISMTTNAGSVTVDLSGATATSMSYTLNAGSTKITLPASSFSGSFTVNAGSLAFCLPPGVGLQISANDNFLASNNFTERGLSRAGSVWTTPGFAAAATRIDLSATVNLGRIELDPGGGCK
jgi:hypothetical protein